MANEIRGDEPKIYVNGTLWHVKTGGPKETMDTERGDTTGTGQFKIEVPTKKQFTVTHKALRYSNLNPHAVPLGLYPGAVIAYKYKLREADQDVDSWRCATFVVTGYSETFDAESGLVALELEGKSSGEYKRPGEA